MSNDDTDFLPPATGPVDPVPAPQPASGMRWLIPTLGALVAVGIGLIGGIAIGQGTASARQVSSSALGRQFGTGAGQGGSAGGSGFGGRNFAAGGFTSGTVVSVSGDRLVVKSPAGTDVTVTATSSTRVTKQQTVKLSDLRAGERVTAVGTPSGSNGDLTATTISEGGSFGGRFGRPGATAPASPAPAG